MSRNQILLNRKNASFKAGFSIIKKELNELVKEYHLLHSDETAYYDTLKFDRRKTSYLLGRIAAKKAIFELLSQEVRFNSFSIQHGVFQFPVVKYLQNQNIQVTISHCDNIGISLAFQEEHPIGIDIEKIDEDKVNFMKNFISSKESDKTSLNSLSLSVGNILIWSVKEALSKVLKTGLTLDYLLLEIDSFQKVNSEYVSTFKYFTQYKAISCRIGDYMCSVVLPKNTSCDLTCFWNTLRNLKND